MPLQQVEPLERACGTNASWLCETVFDQTENRGLAKFVDNVLGGGVKILLILVLAVVAHLLVRRAIDKLARRITDPSSRERLKERGPGAVVESGMLSLRAAARAHTLTQVMRSAATVLIWTIAFAMILGELGVNLGPLIAGAGIAGIALGFGAQSLVKDFLTGIFMLVEDQYGVGDIVDLGEARGSVEAVTLRTTRLRDVNGTVWHIPNGAIQRVGNLSQEWARALLDVNVAHDTDLDLAYRVIKDAADRLWREPSWRGEILEEPEVWGVEQLGPEGILIRLVVKTKPAGQFDVMRELRRRLSEAFRDNDIEMPSPQRMVWVGRDAGSSHEMADDTQVGAQPPGDPAAEPRG